MTVHATWFYSYEACKTHDAEGQRLIKKAFTSASEKGVTVHSVYSNRPEHTMFMVLEADTFEQIDVFTKEETAPDHPLLTLDNVVYTPHVAALSVESKRDNSQGSIENLVALLSGHWPDPQNMVNQGVISRFPLKDYDEGKI